MREQLQPVDVVGLAVAVTAGDCVSEGLDVESSPQAARLRAATAVIITMTLRKIIIHLDVLSTVARSVPSV
jgi:hypothetical protein